jgi:hypothetical protein
MSLVQTTPELWPSNARQILKVKNIDVDKLKNEFSKVYFPWDSQYLSHTNYFSLTVQQRPLIVFVPIKTQELEKIMNFIKEKNLSIRLINGRHSSQLLDPEVLVDLSRFNKIKITKNIIEVGGGSTQGQANEFLFSNDKRNYSHFGHPTHPHNSTIKAFAGGSAASIGCAGICTSGGVGVLPRSFGLTIDSIISYTVTLPPTAQTHSRTVVADQNHHRKLFWALRGGGGANFGIISSLKLRIIKVPELAKYTISWPFDNAVEVLELWKQTSPDRPDHFEEDISVSSNAQECSLSLVGYYLFQDGETLETATAKISQEMAPLLSPFKGVLTVIGIEYDSLYRSLVENRKYYNFSYIQVYFINNFSSQKIVKYVKKNQHAEVFQTISFQLLGAQIRETPRKSTAFFPRKANFFMDTATLWNREQNSQQRSQWMHSLDQYVLGNNIGKTIMYVGFPIPFTDLAVIEGNQIYYGKHYKKLQKIKKQIDPLELLTPCGTINA